MRGCIKLWRPLLVAILLFSGSVFADTYPAVLVGSYSYTKGSFPTVAEACADMSYSAQIWKASMGGGASCVVTDANTGAALGTQAIYDQSYMGCPSGGTLSGSTCINAPACTTGQYRDSSGVCRTPVFCLYPEVDDGTGHCHVPPECPAGQKFNYKASPPQCAVPPVCGATEKLNSATFACDPNPLNCPFHSHANTANDGCLPDAPLTCAIGMHDDGTYNCVANDAPAPCNSDQQKGYIGNPPVPQCIPKPNLDTKQQAAATAAGNSNASSSGASQAAAAAKAAADTAAASAAAAAADPTNSAKSQQAASDAAASTSASASKDSAAAAAGAAKDAAAAADNDAKNAYMKATADGVRHIDDSINKSSGKTPFSKFAPGAAPSDGNVAIIDAKKVELRALMGNVKAQFAGLTPSLSGGGAVACDAGINIPSLHISVSFCINSFLQYLPNLGTAIYFTAVFMALAIILV